MAQSTPEEFVKTLDKQGKSIFDWLVKTGQSREWLAEQLGISTKALNYKMQGKHGGFRTAELHLLKTTQGL